MRDTKQNNFSYGKYLHLAEPCISKLLIKIKHFRVLHCDILTDCGYFVGAGQEILQNEKDNKIPRGETLTDLYSLFATGTDTSVITLQVAIFLFLKYHKA